MREYVTLAEGGREVPSEAFIRRCGQVYGATERLLDLHDQAAAERMAERAGKAPAPAISYPEEPTQSMAALVQATALQGSVVILVENGRVVILNRRDLLTNGVVLSGAALADVPLQFISPAQAEPVGRLDLLDQTASFGGSEPASLALITESYRQLYDTVPAVDLRDGVTGHFSTVSQRMKSSPEGLLTIHGDSAHLAARLYFYLGDLPSAQHYYEAALESAEEAEDYTLQVYTLSYMALIPIYGGDPRDAIARLEGEHGRLRKVAPMPRVLFAVIEAEAYATAGDAKWSPPEVRRGLTSERVLW